MKNTLTTWLLLMPTLLLSAAAMAQGPGPGGPIPNSPPATAVPIDGGASLLLAAGAAYGLRKIRQRHSRK